ncbi:MAG: class B sortase [Lachnospiraceae bacterium]|nr:class B sortase [Lachnospiraceae bacterium]
MGQVVPDYFGKRTTEVVADGTGESYKQVQRFIRLTELIPDLLEMEDNEFYLSHLADGTSNSNGCLFIDCRNSEGFSDENTIIYVHHMASGKMFASLIRYVEQEYYEAHPVMYLSVEGKTYPLELFAGYTTTEDSSAYRMQFDTSHEFAEWLREISAKSDFTANIRLTTENRIVTLSTCAYSFENARYVVHGRLVELDEAAE